MAPYGITMPQWFNILRPLEYLSWNDWYDKQPRNHANKHIHVYLLAYIPRVTDTDATALVQQNVRQYDFYSLKPVHMWNVGHGICETASYIREHMFIYLFIFILHTLFQGSHMSMM